MQSRARSLAFAATLMVLLPVALALPGGGGARDAHGNPTAPAAQLAPATPGSVPDVIERVRALTVLLEGDGIYGSGLLVDPAHGRILTSYHVVSEMRAPRVTTFDGRTAKARVVATDQKLDLAVLESAELVSPHLVLPPLGDPTHLRPGEDVYAIGAPRKLAFTVSRGIVSYVGREMEGARYVQLDMAINDGNSGGPVFTPSGQVIGIMSFILKRSQGLAFALPIDYALGAFPEVLATPLAALTSPPH